MPQLSSSNRSQLRYKPEGTYPTNFGVPQGGNGTNLNILSETLDFTIKNEQSKTIRDDRQVTDTVQVSGSAQGGFAFESQYVEYDRFMEDVVGNLFAMFGTNGAGTAVADITVTSTTLTAGVATSGANSWATLTKGQWFAIIPDAAASTAVKNYLKGRAFRVSTTVAPTTTVITLHASTPIDTAIVSGDALDGAKLGTSYATNGTLMRSYTLEEGHGDITVFRQYKGMIPSKFSQKLTVGAIVTGDFEFMGKDMALLGATSMGTPVSSQTFTPPNSTRGIFDVFEAGASVTATTYIKGGEFMIDGSLRMQDAIGVFGAAGIAQGTFNVSGKLTMYFASSVMYQKFLDGVSSSLSIPILDVDGNGYVYTFPRIKYTAAKVQVGGLDQDNMLELDFQALMDTDAASATYQKTLAISRVGVAVA